MIFWRPICLTVTSSRREQVGTDGIMSQAPLIRCIIRFQMPTYLSHFPPKCSAADQLVCMLYIALCPPIPRVKGSCQRLFHTRKSRDIPHPNNIVPSSPRLDLSRRVYSNSRGACILLCSRIPLVGQASSSVGYRSRFHRSMATAAVLASSRALRPSFEPIIQGETSSKTCNVAFDPEKHLAFIPPSMVYTMKDLSLDDIGVSPVAVSEPFSLFSLEAIQHMRAEVLSEQVWDNCQYSSNLAQCQLRGFAPAYVLPVFA